MKIAFILSSLALLLTGCYAGRGWHHRHDSGYDRRYDNYDDRYGQSGDYRHNDGRYHHSEGNDHPDNFKYRP